VWRLQSPAAINGVSKLLHCMEYEDWIDLTPTTGLIGHGYWADGRYGDFHSSRRILNDWKVIEELKKWSKGPHTLSSLRAERRIWETIKLPLAQGLLMNAEANSKWMHDEHVTDTIAYFQLERINCIAGAGDHSAIQKALVDWYDHYPRKDRPQDWRRILLESAIQANCVTAILADPNLDEQFRELDATRSRSSAIVLLRELCELKHRMSPAVVDLIARQLRAWPDFDAIRQSDEFQAVLREWPVVILTGLTQLRTLELAGCRGVRPIPRPSKSPSGRACDNGLVPSHARPMSGFFAGACTRRRLPVCA